MKPTFHDGQRVRYTPTGETVTIDDDEGGDRVQIAHDNGSYSYVPRWHLEPRQ